MSTKNVPAFVVILALCVTLVSGCTTVTRSDGSTVRIPAAGYVGAMAAANITCQDNVQALMSENAKLKARIAELEAKLSEAKK
jgi:uncharacterized protein YceK